MARFTEICFVFLLFLLTNQQNVSGTDDIELVDANPERKADKKSAGHRTPPPASLASLAAAVLLGVATLRLWG